jgi:hypothetical protein
MYFYYVIRYDKIHINTLGEKFVFKKDMFGSRVEIISGSIRRAEGGVESAKRR